MIEKSNIQSIEGFSNIKISDIIEAYVHMTSDKEIDIFKYENWYDVDIDELDFVEFIMILEKNTNKWIDDKICEIIQEMGPKKLFSDIKRYQRNIKINKILK